MSELPLETSSIHENGRTDNSDEVAVTLPDGVSGAISGVRALTNDTGANTDFGELEAEEGIGSTAPRNTDLDQAQDSNLFEHEGEVALGSYELPTIRETFTPVGRTGVPMEADVIPSLPPGNVTTFTDIALGHEKIAVDPEILGRVIDSTRESYRLNEDGYDAFCDEFATMVCGGTYNPTHRGDRTFNDIEPPRFEYDASATIQASDTEAIDRLPIMQPIELGVLDEDGTLEPYHTIVKLPGASGLYVGKLGQGPVVLTDLPQLAAYYGTTHCVPVARIRSGSERFGSILEYTHPSYDSSHAYTITKIPFEDTAEHHPLEEPARHENTGATELAEDNVTDPWL